MMGLPFRIALRYLFSWRQIGFVSVISMISIVGVTIGVTALIVILSVFNGFNGLVTSILVSFDPHLRVESPKRATVGDYRALVSFIEREPDVVGFSPFVSGKALVVARNSNRVINVKGIEDSTIVRVSGLREKIVLGGLDLHGDDANGIVLGLTLADRLGSVVGDTVSIVSPAGSEAALMSLGQPVIRRYRVVGIYESNNKDYDGYYAYVGLEAAQKLFAVDSMINGIELRLSSLERASSVKQRIVERFGGRFRVFTWYDLHRELYSVMQIERWMAYIILSLIVGVASFHLLGGLTMSVIEKTRDIGILKSFGATRRMIVRIFLLQGVLVGVIGSTFGLILGLLLVLLQDKFHLFPLDPTVYIIPAIPVAVHVSDCILVPMTAIFLCSVAAIYPARRAGSLLPAEAVRWE